MSNLINKEWLESQKNDNELDVQLLKQNFENISDSPISDQDLDCANELIDFFIEKKRLQDAVMILQWIANHPCNKDDIIIKLKYIYESNKNAQKLIKPSGFENDEPLKLSFNKLNYLLKLKEGSQCFHETWGFGIISEVDYFYNELVIDFDKKSDHVIAFNYAVESLSLLKEDHILSIRHNNIDHLNDMIKKDPGEVVRLALKSYGNMTVARLMDRLVPNIVSENDWKKFWDAARKKLKTDASIEIPKKRSDFIELHEGISSEYDDSWFKQLELENNIEKLFEKFKDIIDKKICIESDVIRNILGERLAYIINGSPISKPEWKAEGFIFARLFNIDPEGLDVDKILHQLIEDELGIILEKLPSRQLETLLSILIENDREELIARLKKIIQLVGFSVLNEIFSSLRKYDAEDEVIEILSNSLARRKASASMLLWCVKSQNLLNEWSLITRSDLAFRIQESLELNLSGILLRSQNQLRDKFQQEGWLYESLEDMTDQQRRDFLRRINEGQGWDTLDRKSLLAKVLRKYPELQEIVTPTNTTIQRKEVPFTSSRSFRERQQQLEKIMKIDIPENSKEIEVARSYGDLRENAEFKYAKERQGLLMAQGAKLAEDLEIVKPTDFTDISTDKINIGTGVALEFEDNSHITYFILGVWDQDDDLKIISSETKLAKLLLGLSVGDDVNLPDGKAIVRDIISLTNEIKQWIST